MALPDRLCLGTTWKFYEFNEGIGEIRDEALDEVLRSKPSQLRTHLSSYGLTPPCRAYSDAVLRAMICPLSNWVVTRSMLIKDLDAPWIRPQALRLEPGGTLWPKKGSLVVLVPLNTDTIEVEFIPRFGTASAGFEWEPNVIIRMTEAGLRFTGKGCLRFICILLTLERDNVRRLPHLTALMEDYQPSLVSGR